MSSACPKLTDGIHGFRRYFLFFSSNCFNTNLYDISYATASSVKGPYTKASTPFKVTGDNGLTAPGGLSALPDGSLAVRDRLLFRSFKANYNISGLSRHL
jgi:hypothetical protein